MVSGLMGGREIRNSFHFRDLMRCYEGKVTAVSTWRWEESGFVVILRGKALAYMYNIGFHSSDTVFV